ncbi:MAG: NAD-dependent epimerase/dehydratase family protein [Nevskia sp.]|nr:NAD-dependent epimerase/dehydratase family protein [Nevskia sp.]
MKVFVTGGSGFVGRNLIVMLAARGDTVAALARTPAAMRTVRELGAEPVTGDLDDLQAMQAGMAGAGAVVHCAAKVEDWGDPAEFHRINVEGTGRVIAAARAAGVPRLVHVSTEAVLADGTPIRNADETRPRAPHPIGLYPATKAEAEKLAVAASGPGLDVMVVRPRFIWGKGDTAILPKLVEVMRKKQFAWIGGGRYLTSTCHVRNVCEGILLAAERGKPGEIYFLTDGAPVEFRGFITAMAATQGVDAGTRQIPRGLVYAFAAAGEFLWRVLPLKGRPLVSRTAVILTGEEVTVNDAKARRELGYRGLVSREAGLAEMA